jgi:hypothetical protein
MSEDRQRGRRRARRRFAAAWLLPAVFVAAVAAGPKASAPSPALLRMHDDFVLAFVDSEGFGIRRLPAMAPMLRKPVDGTPWFVADLELIGVAKHDPPRAFGGGFSMDVFHKPASQMPLQRGPGRAITREERRALRALDAGERLVVVPEDAGVRVTGAIRAGDECLGCHKRKRAGDLLGAFVYHLQPVTPGRR